MPKFSIVVPVYNRPDEIEELLTSLSKQSFSDFEVIIVEDGSTLTCEEVVNSFSTKLDVKYLSKQNEGQGFARNYGYKYASGDYYIVFDSDCLIPRDYLSEVNHFLSNNWVDAYGGPDTFHPEFTIIQKAISHTMTSMLTTGGIRGKRKVVKGFHPRSFNMGISKKVFQQTKGYRIPFMGEDMEFSTRIINMGFKTALIPRAFVYHKRRTSLSKFARQLHYFGRARINLSRFQKGQLKLIHLMPVVFSFGLLAVLLLSTFGAAIGYLGLSFLGTYFLIIIIEGILKTRSLWAGLISPVLVCIQFYAYSYGLIYEWIRKQRGIDPNTKYIDIY